MMQNDESDSNLKDDEISSEITETFHIDAPDGGYGWVIVFLGFMVSVLADGVNYSFGLFYTVYIMEFQANGADVAWVGSIASGIYVGIMMLTGYYIDKYGKFFLLIPLD